MQSAATVEVEDNEESGLAGWKLSLRDKSAVTGSGRAMFSHSGKVTMEKMIPISKKPQHSVGSAGV